MGIIQIVQLNKIELNYVYVGAKIAAIKRLRKYQ